MLSRQLFSVGCCAIAVVIFMSQALEVSATLPLVKSNDASKLTKSNDIEKPSKINPKLVLKGDGKNFVISNTTSKLAAKKLALENKPPLKTKSIEPKPINPKLATKSATSKIETKSAAAKTPTKPGSPKIAPKASTVASNSLTKQRPTPKPKSTPDKKTQTRLQTAQKRLNQNKVAGTEKFISESKITDMIEKQISPIINMLTKAATTYSKTNEAANKDHSKLLRQLEPADDLERLEGIDSSVRHLQNFMNIISKVDDYLKTKAESALQQLAFIYGGDILKKPAKSSKLHKPKVHRLRRKRHGHD